MEAVCWEALEHGEEVVGSVGCSAEGEAPFPEPLAALGMEAGVAVLAGLPTALGLCLARWMMPRAL